MRIANVRAPILLRVTLVLLLIVVVNDESRAIEPLPLAIPLNNTVTAFASRLSNDEQIAYAFSQPLTDTHWSFLPTIFNNYILTYTFTLQAGSPAYLANFANPAGCNWLGMAGQVFNTIGQPQLTYIIHLEGNGLNQNSITGSHPVYGPGGYEHYLNDHPIAATYTVQLRDPYGNNVSPVYEIPTFADCKKNLVVVNFVELQ